MDVTKNLVGLAEAWAENRADALTQPDPSQDVAAAEYRAALEKTGKAQNPFEINAYQLDGSAYGIGESMEAREKEALLKEKEEAAKKADQHQSVPGMDPGIKADIYTHGNEQTAIVQKGNGNGYSLRMNKDSPMALTILKDGRSQVTEKSSGSFIISDRKDKGFYFDVSHFAGADEKHKMGVQAGKNGTLIFEVDTEGRTSIIASEGAVEPGTVFIKGRDGGIRTNDKEGNLVLANPRALPNDLSRTDRRTHKQLLKSLETHPELADLQGAPPAEPQIAPHEAARQEEQQAIQHTAEPLASLTPEQKGKISQDIAGLLKGSLGASMAETAHNKSQQNSAHQAAPPPTPNSSQEPPGHRPSHGRG